MAATPTERNLKRQVREMTVIQDHLVVTCRRAYDLMVAMESDGGARLPYPGWEEAKAALAGIIAE